CDRRQTVAELTRRHRDRGPGVGRTRLGIALLELGAPEVARAELAVGENPTDRVRFIHQFATWHGDLEVVPGLLRTSTDPASRSGLILAAGSIDPNTLPLDLRRSLDDVLTTLYTDAADGATHSAAGWTLARHGVSLPVLPRTQGPVEGKQWFVNRQG